jgi:hypothetical protein
MTDLDDRVGRCSPVTLSNEKAPSLFRASSPPAPVRLRAPGSRSRPTHGRLPFPAGLAGIRYLDPTAGSVRSR